MQLGALAPRGGVFLSLSLYIYFYFLSLSLSLSIFFLSLFFLFSLFFSCFLVSDEAVAEFPPPSLPKREAFFAKPRQRRGLLLLSRFSGISGISSSPASISSYPSKKLPQKSLFCPNHPKKYPKTYPIWNFFWPNICKTKDFLFSLPSVFHSIKLRLRFGAGAL